MRLYLLVLGVLWSSLGNGQGVNFETSSWQEVLQKAKEEDKFIFVDVYTTWCGPCKRMTKEVFTSEELGAIYNKNFINYKVDAEKGEGETLSDQWEVRAYPTLLFLDYDGNIVSRERGYQSAAFLAGAASSLLEMKNLFAVEPDKYDKDFLKTNLENTKGIHAIDKLPYLEHYFSLLTPEEKSAQENIDLFVNDVSILRGDVLMFLVDYYVNQNSFFPDVHSIFKVDTRLNDLAAEARKNLDKEGILYYHGLRNEMIEGKAALTNKKDEIQKQLDTDLLAYYEEKEGEENAYAEQAKKMMDKYIMIFTPKEVNRVDGYLNEELTANNPRRSATRICNRIKQISYNFYQKYEDEERLGQALEWINFAEELIPDASLLLTKASIYNRLGKHKEAASAIEHARGYHDYPERTYKFSSLLENYGVE